MITQAQKERLEREAKDRCGYCQTQSKFSGIRLTIEHIIPRARGGTDDDDNLWLSCRHCNEKKRTIVEERDQDTCNIVPLFNPRAQRWSEHFTWSADGSEIEPLTAIGRVTVRILGLNDPFRISHRKLWVQVGWHPPE